MATTQRGRPRAFDREQALERALRTFWEHGYEATSVAGLTRAMGISPPSLYAAFGDKRGLFEEVLEVYGATYGAFAGRALAEEPTGRAAVERLLREAAAEYGVTGRPRGCLVITAAINCTSPEVGEDLRRRRNATIALIERRVREDADAGRLAPGADPTALAHYVGAVIQGLSQQARDGAGRAVLEGIAALATAAWPGAPTDV